MFVHLHVHTEYSILDGASKISRVVDKAIADGMPAVAITDHGNMYGIKEFIDYVKKQNSKTNDAIKALKKQIAEAEKNGDDTSDLLRKKAEQEALRFKPIVGCEVYVAEGSRFDRNGREDLGGYHLILLAKNLTGYHNLIKLVSKGYIEGFYGKPRIDHKLLEELHDGLICSSACLAGEVPYNILEGKLDEAERCIAWYKNLFGDDYYLELQRHKATDPTATQDVYPRQVQVNEKLLEWGAKYGIKCVATNDVHFVNEDESMAHDRLLCVSTNAVVNAQNRMRYTRQEWFKTTEEMQRLFADHPEVLENTKEIADKVEFYNIDNNAQMPKFPLPEGFTDDGEYLRHLVYNGATKGNVPGAKGRYPEMTPEVKERIEFELDTILKMGFPGYFLIVQDFIAAARDMGVWVGPGRGSAAGSVVAYCLRITEIDPMKYDLLFERFLNPDRISMPDIDIDFDDEGRAKVLQYVTEKYGEERVAHIVTFGTMAAKSAIKDVARVSQVSLTESNKMTKMVDTLKEQFKEFADWEKKSIVLAKGIEKLPEFKAAAADPLTAETLRYAKMLEGTVRNTGVHACGIIIGSDDLTNFAPIATVEDKDSKQRLSVTQFEGNKVEDVGLIKMDFLGLNTLSILKEAVHNIKLSRGIDLNIDTIPIDDKATYALFARGDTAGTFQFESDGMRKHLRNLKPTVFEDLIAMNALYRPGPIDYIPQFIERKHGREPIRYDIPIMEQYLKETYGITVYQEQVMLLSRLLGGFTRGQSDTLRKAMGKKIREKLDALKPLFIEGCKKNGHDEKVVQKIWGDWEKFAEYAFNKSHATCYSWLAYQTAYLKANYPAEYMAALLTCKLNNAVAVSSYMDEAHRMGIQVLPPDVNESLITFTVNKAGNIRFGLGAIKGVGSVAAEQIIAERDENGTFKDIYDFVERLNLQTCNKRVLEALAGAGAFDTLGPARGAYLVPPPPNEASFVDMLLRYGAAAQASKNSSQQSLFGGSSGVSDVHKPAPPVASEMSSMAILNRERELVGIYLSSHPLDEFKVVFDQIVTCTMSDLDNLDKHYGKSLVLGGFVTKTGEFMSKKGNPYGRITIEDFSGSHEFTLFGESYTQFKNFFITNSAVLVRASVQERPHFGAPDSSTPRELELKINKMRLMRDFLDKDIRKITATLNIEAINNDLIGMLNERLAAIPKGPSRLLLNIINKHDGVSVEMISHKYPSLQYGKEVEEMFAECGLEYRIG